MKIKTILCTLCAVTVLGSCSYDDDGLWDAVNGQEERISALEKWQKTVVDQLNSLQGILTATDYVTNVGKVEKDGAQGPYRGYGHGSQCAYPDKYGYWKMPMPYYWHCRA